MTTYQIACADTDSYLLGETTYRVSDPELKKHCYWRFGKDGSPHEAICPECGAVLFPDRWDRSTFVLRKKDYDIGTTYEEELIVSDKARSFLEGCKLGDSSFEEIKSSKGFHWWDIRGLPVAKLDREQSGLRPDLYCETCKDNSQLLRGMVKGTPPEVLPYVFQEEVKADILYRTDCQIGTGHSKNYALIAGEAFAERLFAAKLKKVYVIENVRCRAGRPKIKKF